MIFSTSVWSHSKTAKVFAMMLISFITPCFQYIISYRCIVIVKWVRNFFWVSNGFVIFYYASWVHIVFWLDIDYFFNASPDFLQVLRIFCEVLIVIVFLLCLVKFVISFLISLNFLFNVSFRMGSLHFMYFLKASFFFFNFYKNQIRRQ